MLTISNCKRHTVFSKKNVTTEKLVMSSMNLLKKLYIKLKHSANCES